MEHSKNFVKVRTYYNTTIDGKRLWSLAMVKKAVVKGWITEAEFKEITGEDYSERQNQ